MKRTGFKTYKFGKLTINVFTNEIVIIYIGKRRTYIKNFLRHRVHHFSKIAAIAMSVFLVTTISVTAFSSDDREDVVKGAINLDQLEDVNEKNFSAEEKGDINRIIEDEKLKNKLLNSQDTDYSKPVENNKLQITQHTVKRGENLNIIAKKYGVSIDTVCGSNSLKSYDFIKEGLKLQIPNKDGILYKMKKGSNIVDIAKKYKVSVKKIIASNNFSNSDFIPVDSVLFVPDAKPQNIVSGFLWPTRGRRITCSFGWRRNPFNHSYKEFHKGLDIAARYESIKSTKYGKVTYAGWMGGYGNAIIIAHPNGWKSLYGHLSRIIVKTGQYVKQGQVIARSGNTGRSTGPHLHFELIKNGSNKNPRKFLKK